MREIILSTVCFLLLGCYEENDQIGCVMEEAIYFEDTSFYIGYPGPQEDGVVECIKNGKLWEGSLTARRFTNGMLYIHLVNYPDSFASHSYEVLSFISVPNKGGCYDLCSCDDSLRVKTVNHTKLSFDNIGDVYDVSQMDGYGNVLEVTSIEGDSIWGRFSVSFQMALDKSKNVSGNPENIRFYNGKFEGRILE